jgi:amino acid permease
MLCTKIIIDINSGDVLGIHIRQSLNQSVKHLIDKESHWHFYWWRHGYCAVIHIHIIWSLNHSEKHFIYKIIIAITTNRVVILWGYQHHTVPQPTCETFYDQMISLPLLLVTWCILCVINIHIWWSLNQSEKHVKKQTKMREKRMKGVWN